MPAPSTRTVTGPLHDANGDLLTGYKLVFTRIGAPVNVDGAAVMPVFGAAALRDEVTTHASTADFSVTLVLGGYQITLTGPDGAQTITRYVPEGDGPISFAGLLDAQPVYSETVVQQVTAAAIRAEDAAARVEEAQAEAEDARDETLGARDAAEIFASGAATAAVFYATIALGRAAVADGATFGVVAGGADALTRPTLFRRDTSSTQTEIVGLVAASEVDQQSDNLDELRDPLARVSGDLGVYPLVIDPSGRIILGVDEVSGRVIGSGFGDQATEALLGIAGVARYTGAGPVWPALLDAGGRVVLGYNATTGQVVGALAAEVKATSWPVEALPVPIVPAAINHALFYGQSLSVGAAGGTVISTAQPYSNVTFAGGPRAWNGTTWDFGTLKPLVEDSVAPAPDGQTNRSETPCSGAANYASSLLAQAGTAPADHVILASAAGHGGYRIDQLDAASAWYPNLIAHVAGAQALNSDHAVHALCWLQGENDVSAATPYATYRAALAQLQVDAQADIQGETGQTHPLYCLTYQTSYGAATHEEIALAQLDLAQRNERFFLSTPLYHLPYSDGVHLTAIGYKWAGAYFGRAYSEIVLGRRPRWLNPVSATRRGAEVRVRFQVPTLPLVLDTATLAVTTNHGFVVTDGGAPATISAIAVDGSEVVITLAAVPSGAVVVRYALDTLGAGLTITTGASGNVRDSTPDTIMISGAARPLYHVAPHFQLTAIALSE